MQTAYHATLLSNQLLGGSGVIPFQNLVRPSDDIEMDPSGTSVKMLTTKPRTFNISVEAQNGALIDIVLLKNGDPFKVIARQVSRICASASDPLCAKGDVYGVEIGMASETGFTADPTNNSLSIV